MPINATEATLQEIPVDSVDRNEENPRLVFRQQEMDQLLESIRQHGIQVPVSVYRDRRRYILIDGERRWRCALKLNLKTIPALVQDKPDRLTNILLMFNIHALREQWDLLTIALKLKDVLDLLETKNGRAPTEAEVASYTGLARGVVRRCRLLLELPEEYRQQILEELEKPKRQQKLTEDFFIEMERALKTVERAMPDVLPDKDRARQVLIQKFRADIIPNRVHFRDLARIARVRSVASDTAPAKLALKHVFSKNRYSIKQAYADSVSEAYTERDVVQRIEALIERLSTLDEGVLDDALRQRLQDLVAVATKLLSR